MQRQRKWAIGILLCIVAVLLAIWVGVAKDEKDGDRESLYENEDYGLGFWMPQGYTENPFYISDMETVGNGLMVEFFAPERICRFSPSGIWIRRIGKMKSRKAIRGCIDRFMRMRNGCCSAFL